MRYSYAITGLWNHAQPVAGSAALALFMLCAPLGCAQTQPGPPAFEAASVKPSDGMKGIGLRALPNRLSSDCNLRDLIAAAYSMERWQVTGGPAWLDSDLFAVEAKTGEDLSRDEDRVAALDGFAPRKMMLMLQTLLSDRFNLKVHRETRQDNVYSLVVVKNSQKLQPPAETTRSWVGMSRGGKIEVSADGSPDFSAATMIVTGHNATMGQLAAYLTRRVRRPVEDKTGIRGNYDFVVEYASDNSQADAPAFSTALQNATGLKLNSAKGAVEFLVVDRADKPSAN
jgi:uncharacterized protein (TIGR03435 family)